MITTEVTWTEAMRMIEEDHGEIIRAHEMAAIGHPDSYPEDFIVLEQPNRPDYWGDVYWLNSRDNKVCEECGKHEYPHWPDDDVCECLPDWLPPIEINDTEESDEDWDRAAELSAYDVETYICRL